LWQWESGNVKTMDKEKGRVFHHSGPHLQRGNTSKIAALEKGIKNFLKERTRRVCGVTHRIMTRKKGLKLATRRLGDHVWGPGVGKVRLWVTTRLGGGFKI